MSFAREAHLNHHFALEERGFPAEVVGRCFDNQARVAILELRRAPVPTMKFRAPSATPRCQKMRRTGCVVSQVCRRLTS